MGDKNTIETPSSLILYCVFLTSHYCGIKHPNSIVHRGNSNLFLPYGDLPVHSIIGKEFFLAYPGRQIHTATPAPLTQSQYLTTPSTPAVATLLVSAGFHCTHVTAPSPPLNRFPPNASQVLQSQKQTPPPASPLITNPPSGLTLTSTAYPAVWWPLKAFLRFWRKRSVEL